MTIRQIIKKYGWQMKCDVKPGRFMSVGIGFMNEKGKEDETQMDINAYDEQELSELFADFCRENQLLDDTVTYITIVQIADTMDKLLYG